MRIILDEGVPQKLRLLIDGHTVVTTSCIWSIEITDCASVVVGRRCIE